MTADTFSPERILERALDTEMISVEQLRQLNAAALPGVVPLDVRSVEEIREGVIPGSALFPCEHNQVDREDTAIFSRCFHERFRPEDFDPAKTYVLICRTGQRTAIALDVFQQHGLACCELLGGIVEWRRHGLPLDPVSI
ncbi:MAG: rhodanese-like domain-containing protein [Hyphomicrobiales bacterium]|nr:rhodanese-like domain-containing protein [Hyphomicrobiales bacterium]MCP5374058.1 rhodanese-like domain-containing protein [Hyphomicrobiales bacterium]